MPEDTLRVTIDPSNSFDVLQRLGGATDRLGQSGERIGAGFLRGDRVVRTATANITQGLLTANNAADATLITMQSLERVFRIPIGLTVFTAAAIAAGVAIVNMIEKASKLREEIRKLTSFSKSGSADFLGTDQINKNLDDIGKKIEELSAGIVTRSHSLVGGILNFLGPNAQKIIPAQNAADQERIEQLRRGAAGDVLNLTSKQNDLNRASLEELDGDKEKAELDKAEIDHKERLGKLAEAAVTAGLAGTEAARQLLSVENDRYNIAVKTLKTKQDESNLKASIKTAQAVDNFFSDVGSGKFAKDFAQEQGRRVQSQHGRELVDEIEKGQAQGFFKDPLSQAILKDAQRLAKQEKTGLPALLNADFTNLLDLSRYDFSGLTPLSGLTISIQ